jgi:hypothetical protein
MSDVNWEHREERRRVWWLLYILDRHLALSFNRPISLHDSHCQDLLQPMDDRAWQAGRDSNHDQYLEGIEYALRKRGPTYECRSLDFSGFFLPLMTILGYIIQLRNEERGYNYYKNNSSMNAELDRISNMLGSYERSLSDIESQLHTSTASSDCTSPDSPIWPNQAGGSGMPVETTIAAYARCIMHVLHVLLRAKWDPTSIFEDQDFWISSRSFGQAMSSALSASESIEKILVHDPEFTYMPYFIRVFLVQGSLIPLLAVETLGSGCNPSVIKACKTIVKAHEACVMTLDSEFQVRLKMPYSI